MTTLEASTQIDTPGSAAQGAFGSDYGAVMALAPLSVPPMIALFLIFQRYFVQGFARSGIR